MHGATHSVGGHTSGWLRLAAKNARCAGSGKRTRVKRCVVR
ncbi:hypothetical protein GBP346_B2834 [Burkholderia pseudomallei MSHR346]|nr:hypothetical protein GBP346_B2834 [Burkholderia pseudomallei MSHR346]